MGFTPMQVDQMTLWEFSACVAAHQGGDRKGDAEVSEERLRSMGIKGF